jgi:hypothetical protein
MIHPDETLRITAASALRHSSLRSLVRRTSKVQPVQSAPAPPAALLNVSISSTSTAIYRDPAVPKKQGNMSHPKRTRAGLTTSPSRETLRSNGTAKPIRVKALSPSKKANGAPTHRRVVSKAKNAAAAHPSSPARVKNHSPAQSVATPPKYLRATNAGVAMSPTSPPRTKHRNPDRNLGEPGTESPKTRNRHSRVLVDVTVAGGNEQQTYSVVRSVKSVAKGDRKEQLGKFPHSMFKLIQAATDSIWVS